MNKTQYAPFEVLSLTCAKCDFSVLIPQTIKKAFQTYKDHFFNLTELRCDVCNQPLDTHILLYDSEQNWHDFLFCFREIPHSFLIF